MTFCSLLLNISRIYLSLEKEKTGIKFANQAFEIAESIKDKLGIEQVYNIVNNINKKNKKYNNLLKDMENQMEKLSN